MTLSIRNRNKGKVGKDGKAKAPNWEYRFEGAKVDGKRQQFSKSGFSTKKEAELAGTKALAEYNNSGLHFEPSEISVKDYFDYWLENYCKFNVSDSTFCAYSNILNRHVLPRIGQYRLKSVTSLILQDMINNIYANECFSKLFMKNILKVVKGGFKYAKNTAQLIKDNPAENVSLPAMRKESEPEEIIVLTKDEINRILNRFEKNPSVYYAILTAYYTGFRVGEVIGLTWDCIDFENKTITVNKIAKNIDVPNKVENNNVTKKSKLKWYLGDCKTRSSYRTVNVGNTLIDALKDYKAWQEANEIEYGSLYTHQYLKDEISPANKHVQLIVSMQDLDFEIPLRKTDLVFVKENGNYCGENAIKYASKVINYELGIKFNFHALRHTHATMLIETGVPIKAVSERLGHANVRTTLETYVHVTDTMRCDCVDKFEQIGNLGNSNIISFNDSIRKKNRKAE